MAIKIGSTIVFNDSAQMSWNILNSKPDIISTLVKTKTGDLTTDGTAYNVNYSSSNGRLEILYNTNCACVCDCDCGGPMGCFLGSEYVLMADGKEKRLDSVRPGEWIACHFSGTAPVFAVRETEVRHNKMFKINNDMITTGEHAFWSPTTYEWLVCDKTSDARTTSPRRRVKANFSGQQSVMKIPAGLSPRQMKVGDRLLVGDNLVTVFKIEPITLPETSPKLITLITTTSMIIRGGWVVSGWSGKDFDKPIHNDIDRRLKLLRQEIKEDSYVLAL
jgi:hypothetical protein